MKKNLEKNIRIFCMLKKKKNKNLKKRKENTLNTHNSATTIILVLENGNRNGSLESESEIA